MFHYKARSSGSSTARAGSGGHLAQAPMELELIGHGALTAHRGHGLLCPGPQSLAVSLSPLLCHSGGRGRGIHYERSRDRVSPVDRVHGGGAETASRFIPDHVGSGTKSDHVGRFGHAETGARQRTGR